MKVKNELLMMIWVKSSYVKYATDESVTTYLKAA